MTGAGSNSRPMQPCRADGHRTITEGRLDRPAAPSGPGQGRNPGGHPRTWPSLGGPNRFVGSFAGFFLPPQDFSRIALVAQKFDVGRHPPPGGHIKDSRRRGSGPLRVQSFAPRPQTNRGLSRCNATSPASDAARPRPQPDRSAGSVRRPAARRRKRRDGGPDCRPGDRPRRLAWCSPAKTAEPTSSRRRLAGRRARRNVLHAAGRGSAGPAGNFLQFRGAARKTPGSGPVPLRRGFPRYPPPGGAAPPHPAIGARCPNAQPARLRSGNDFFANVNDAARLSRRRRSATT